MTEPNISLRDRAFASLLLLVGGAAVATGLLEIFWIGNTAPVSIFDAVLGSAILLVTWLFVVPAVWPRWYGDPEPGSPAVRRPYLAQPIVAAPQGGRLGGDSRGPSRSTTTRNLSPSGNLRVAPPPEIPKWADPLVLRPAPPGSATSFSSAPRSRLPVESARIVSPPATPAPAKSTSWPTVFPSEAFGPSNPPFFSGPSLSPSSMEVDESAPEDAEEEAKVSVEREDSAPPVANSSSATHPPSVIMELDLIAEELRTPARRPRRRTVSPRAGGTSPEAPVGENDSDHQSLAGLD